MMHRSLVVASILSFAGFALATQPVAAQPGLTDPTEVAPDSAPERASADTDDDTGVAVEDPRGDHGLLVHTALTQPRGTYTFHDREVVFPGVTYGLTDRAQISATIMTAPALILIGEAKLRVLDRGPFHLALDSLVSSLTFDENDRGLVGLFGVTATVCFDRHCRNSLSSSLMAGGIRPLDFPDDGINVLYTSAGLATRVVPGVKALFEVQGIMARDMFSGDLERLRTIMAGLRLYKNWIAFDIGLMAAATRSPWTDGWDFVYGITPNILGPWVNFTYRRAGRSAR